MPVRAIRRGHPTLARLAVIVALSALVNAGATGCAGRPAAPGTDQSAAPVAGSTAPVSPAATTGSPAHPGAASTGPPGFPVTVSPVDAAGLGLSWHPGCPVGPAALRALRLGYWGFDGTRHTGTLIVNAAVVDQVIRVFAELYRQRFPIRSLRPVADFGASDPASMAADNTSGFNCRYAVAAGTPSWSAHAYGTAIDVNTVENPYLEGGRVQPPAGVAYLDRSRYRPGMAVPGGVLVRAFAAVGWQWGGRWSGTPDYQHFSRDGR